MYPRNAASPERIAIGPVVQVSDGAVQTSGVSVKVLPQGATASAGGGTVAYEEGIVHYVPTQAETNYTSFVLIAYKTGCIPASTTVVTSASATAGTVLLAPVTHTSAVIPTVTTTTTTTNLTNLPSIPANWITAAGITAAALNGKGDWNIGKTGYALTATTGLGNQTANITGNLSGSVGSVTGAVGSVTGNVGGNVAGSVASVTAAVTLPSIPANWLTAAGIATSALNGKGDWNIGKTGYSLTATTGLGNQTANITGNLSGSVGSVTGAVGSVTAAVTLPSIPAGWITAAGVATGAIDADALAADAVTEIWAGSTAPTSSAIADAVWDEAISGHLTAGSTGNALNAAGSAGDPWSTPLPGAYGSGTAGKILGDNLNATVSSRATQTSLDDVPTNAELTSALATADDAVLAVLGTPAGASLAADVASVKGQTAAIEVDTQDLQGRLPTALVSGKIDASVGAMAANVMTAAAAASDLTTELQSGLATASALSTVAAYLDTEVAAILAAVDTEVAAIKAKTDSLTFTVAGQVDANIQLINDVALTGNGQSGTEFGV